MGISVEHVYVLGLLIPLAAYVWWMFRTALRLTGGRRFTAISIRALILLLIVMLLAQVQPYRINEQRNVVFVADRSGSMNEDERIGQWIAEAWRGKEDEDAGGIISFGEHAVVDRGLTKEALPEDDAYRFLTGLKGGYTDLGKGLQLGAAMLRDQGGGRIVLLSDGSENSGNAIRVARLLKDSGIAVDVVSLASELERDAAFDGLNVPASLKQGETFGFEITIQSTFSGAAELRIYQNDRQLSVSGVHLEKGDNRFILQSTALEPGFHRFRAEVHAQGDARAANNSAYAFSRVSGPPKVLLVESVPGSSANLESALASSLIGYDTIAPEQLSLELAEYAAYDSIILNNVPATRIAKKPMEWLGKAVSDYGVGLIMLGGEQSFGLGGYFQTPIEDALPVYMDLKGRKKLPSLGLVLVIDRSGSMSGGNLELAKEAAIRTVELLRDEDTVGVVAFDSTPWWVVEPTKLSDREAVIESIQGVQPGGGTDIYTALDAGYNGLLELEAERKHMILLTDGQSASTSPYSAITDAMNDNLMTLSTVAVGDGADQALLKRLADAAKGRYYFTKDQSTLPAIFSRETVLMSRTYVVDGEFVPAIGDSGNWSSLWRDGVPPVQAYIATTAKELAEVGLWTPDDDPLLARWQYGSGRTVAWTSDASGKWSSDWIRWPSFPKVFAEWVKWTFPQFDPSPYQVKASLKGAKGKLTVESASDAGGAVKLGAVIEGMNSTDGAESGPLGLMPVAPGRYEAELGHLAPGAYLARIGELGREGVLSADGGQTSGLVIPYSPEYRIQGGEGERTLSRIAAITGGRELRLEDAMLSFRGERIASKEIYDWTRELLIASLLLWLLDIAVRRLSVPWRKLAEQVIGKARSKGASARFGGGAVPESASTMARLKKAAAAKTDFYETRDPNSGTRKPVEGPGKSAAKTNPKPAVRMKDEASANEPDRTVEHEKSSQAGQPESAGTVNRLLAAKNRTNNRR